ncbi:hypothetical protein BCR44DRAFT_48414 [Catenaria anguillulae PL171]|uniref:NAD-dependent epimerase/dehydratase domain-containing protein n=1 Tax=Catenaria anguillulae PL171 TaxID=765915 RepID=A0A1Y2H7G9_9FUNG|nr:hypothetical protein BCR44DRAFT_48414 [Catenaria anguillulae PL171]
MPAPSPHAALAAAAALARTLLSSHVLTESPTRTLALALALALIESSTAAIALYWATTPRDAAGNARASVSWTHAFVPGILLAFALATGHAAYQFVPPTLVLAVSVLVTALVSSAILPAVQSHRGILGGGVPPRLVPVLGALAVGVLLLAVVFAPVVDWLPSFFTLSGFVLSICGFALIPAPQLVSVKTLCVASASLFVASVPAGLFTVLLDSRSPFPPVDLLAFALCVGVLALSLAHCSSTTTTSSSSSTSPSRGVASGESAAFLIAALFALALWARGIPSDALATNPMLSVLAFALVYGPAGFLAYLHYRASSNAGRQVTTRYADVSISDDNDDDEHGDMERLGHPPRRSRPSPPLVLAALTGILVSFTLVKLFTTPTPRLVDPCASLLFTRQQPARASPPERKVLITGGAGFIGSHLTSALLALGYSVRILDDFSSGSFHNLVHVAGHAALEVRVGNVLNATQVTSAVKGVDHVYHLAAAAARAGMVDPLVARRALEVNALGTINVLNASRTVGTVRNVVYASSSGCYGSGRGVVSEEGKALGGVSVDATSKFEGEIQMDIYDRIFNLSTTTLRLFSVYGDRQPVSTPLGQLLDQVKNNKTLTIQGEGSQELDFVHVDDAVNTLILAQQHHARVRNQVVNVGTGIGRSLQSVVAMLSSRQTHVPALDLDDASDTLAETCKAKRMLGFAAATNGFDTFLPKLLADTLDPARVTARPTFQALARNLSSTPWLLPPSSLAHVYRPGLYNLTAAAHLATTPLAFLPINATAPDSPQLVVIPYFKQMRMLAQHTYYTAHTLGKVPYMLLVAENTDAARDCLTLNLACFNAEGTPVVVIVARLARMGFTVHVTRLGAAYVRDVWASLNALVHATGAGMLVPAGWKPEAGSGGYVVLPKASALMQAVADAQAAADDDDDGEGEGEGDGQDGAKVRVAFGKGAHYCSSQAECAMAADGKVPVVQFKTAYECMPRAGSPLDDVCDAFAGGHVVYYDAACVKADDEIQGAMSRAGVWWMADGMCPRDKLGCVGVPKSMVGLQEPGMQNECLREGGMAKMVAVEN